MHESHSTKLTLAEIKYVPIEELVRLDLETLRDLENEADKAVFDAGSCLEWIRGVISLKAKKQSARDASAS